MSITLRRSLGGLWVEFSTLHFHNPAMSSIELLRSDDFHTLV